VFEQGLYQDLCGNNRAAAVLVMVRVPFIGRNFESSTGPHPKQCTDHSDLSFFPRQRLRNMFDQLQNSEPLKNALLGELCKHTHADVRHIQIC